MKKDKMRLKGQLGMYMKWPLIMTLLLFAMNIWMYMIDKKAGVMMTVFIAIYLIIASSLYFHNRSLILADLIQFSVQYKGIENRLLKELALPYAIALEDGRILWKNDCFKELMEGQKKEKYLNRLIPDLHPGVFPKDDMEHVEMEVTYRERDYQVELRRVSLQGFSKKEELLQIPEEQEYFVAVSMRDVTELNSYIRENEEQRMIAGLIYPTQGRVLIQGKEISGGKAYPVNLGMLIENPAFLDGYTGLNNLKFLASINQRVTEQEIRDTITRVGLDADDTRKYKKYSLGMKQRLGIAAAIFEHPDILILDEPVNALDEDGVALVQQIIEEEKQRGALILLSCHDREFLEGASDVLYRMKAGVLSEMLGEAQG